MADQVPDLLRGWKQIAEALGAAESTIRGWIADAADDRPPIFKLGDAPNEGARQIHVILHAKKRRDGPCERSSFQPESLGDASLSRLRLGN